MRFLRMHRGHIAPAHHPQARHIAGASLTLMVLLLFGCGTSSPSPAGNPVAPLDQTFHDPQQVTIVGYTGDAMEPFISRDDQYLLFNNLNAGSVNTNLYYAKRVNDTTFTYMGEIQGTNTAALEGTPSMDRAGNLFFISPRSYNQTFSTIYRGTFVAGTVTGVALVPGVSRQQGGIVNFDVEVSPDGTTLWFVDGVFDAKGGPHQSSIVLAEQRGNGFTRDPHSAQILAQVNTDTLQYAPSISADGLELFFTRFGPGTGQPAPTIYHATRPSATTPFGIPARVAAITGFAEGPSLSADGHRLYYHHQENGIFVVVVVTR